MMVQLWVSCPYSSSLSETLDRLFPYSSTLWDTFMLYNVAYPQIRMLIILALQLCPYHHHHYCHHPPLPCTPPPHPPSSGLLLYAEGNKDTRRISVVRRTKWLPETERAMPMGSAATSFSCAPFRRSPPPPCPVFPKVRSLSGSSVDMR